MIDEWLRAAMSDDMVVVKLLLRLKQSNSHPSRPPGKPVAVSLTPLNWGTRQPRSRTAALLSSSKKETEPTRRSPTTPLSWSGGGGGGSGGASPSDGYEESSRPSDRLALAVRSKGIASNNSITNTTASKRPRRKKTIAELKEEESSLLKERMHLKKELASLRITLKEQQSLNENLKRRKLHLQAEVQSKEFSTLNEANTKSHTDSGCETEASSSPGAHANMLKQIGQKNVTDRHDSCMVQNCSTFQEESVFALPDLNMIPDEENGCGDLAGMGQTRR